MPNDFDATEAAIADEVRLLQPLKTPKPVTFRTPSLAKLKAMQAKEDEQKENSSAVHSHVIYG